MTFIQQISSYNTSFTWLPAFKSGNAYFFKGSQFAPSASQSKDGVLGSEFFINGIVANGSLFYLGPVFSPIFNSEAKLVSTAWIVPDPSVSYADYTEVYVDPNPPPGREDSGTLDVTYALSSLDYSGVDVPVMFITSTWTGAAWPAGGGTTQPTVPVLPLFTAILT